MFCCSCKEPFTIWPTRERERPRQRGRWWVFCKKKKQKTNSSSHYLQLMKVIVDVLGIFWAELWLLAIVLVHVLHREQRRGKRLAQLLPVVLYKRTSRLLWDVRYSRYLDDWTRLRGSCIFRGHRCFERGFRLSSFLDRGDHGGCIKGRQVVITTGM